MRNEIRKALTKSAFIIFFTVGEAVKRWPFGAYKPLEAIMAYDEINPAVVDAYYGTSLQGGGWAVVNLPLPFPLSYITKKRQRLSSLGSLGNTVFEACKSAVGFGDQHP